MKNVETVLILGGAGLVGLQIAKRLAVDVTPRKMVIASLFRKDAREAVQELRRLFPSTRFVAVWGDIFRAREGDADKLSEKLEKLEADNRPERSRADMLEERDFRRSVFDSVYGDFDTAYRRSELARLILEHRPQVVVDSVNTATGLSYQDVFGAANLVQRGVDEVRTTRTGGSEPASESFLKDVEVLLISQMVPQLVRHVQLLHRALTEAGTQVYLKIGTTGTGGMGLNIPYTHGEDKPSPVLMSKTAIGFAHTGLLFLMARTPGSPIIKEIKPAAMIGYKDIGMHVIRDRVWQKVETATGSRLVARDRQPVTLYQGQAVELGDMLDVEPRPDGFVPHRDERGDERKLQMVCVNTGENGLFAKGEFTGITAVGQMEFVTPEEIANLASLEIQGHNTGKDVIQAVDSTVLDPTYRAGVIRNLAVQEITRLEDETGIPSVSIGQLGPPQLAKYLYEAWLFRHAFGTLQNVLEQTSPEGGTVARTPEELSKTLLSLLENSEVRDMIVSIGIPILYPDGRTIYRGPVIKIPAYNRKKPRVSLDNGALDAYARRGWVDLRPTHMGWWLERFRRMRRSAATPKVKWSSEWKTRELYLHDTIEIGEVVAWIFGNDEEIRGYRIK